MDRKMRRILLLAVSIILTFGTFLRAEEPKKTAVEKLLDILKEKEIITQTQYKELKGEFAEEENELEEQKQVVQKVKSWEEKIPNMGYKNGFFLETKDKKFKLKFGGRVFADYRGYNSGQPSNSEFFISRARIYLAGTLYNHFEFKVQPDFGKGDSKLKDGFINVNYFPYAQLKIGQFKAPFSLERVTSAKYIDFIERSLPVDNLTPDRDVGIMLHGAYSPIGLSYGVGVFNGTRANEGDIDEHKDLVARVAISPFLKRGPSLLRGLHLGFSTTYGKQDMEYSDDRDYFWNKGDLETAGDTEFFQFNDGVVHDGKRRRVGTELAWMIGPFSVKGEWMRVALKDLKNLWGERHDLSMSGAYISLSYFITGEKQAFSNSKATFQRINPKKIFDPSNGDWGSWQICARYDLLDIDDGFFDHGYADRTQYTDDVVGFTLGLNWYLNDMVRIMFNYNHVEFDDYVREANDDREDVFFARFQLEF
jgi:phosphate-selective porin OprO and OprP